MRQKIQLNSLKIKQYAKLTFRVQTYQVRHNKNRTLTAAVFLQNRVHVLPQGWGRHKKIKIIIEERKISGLTKLKVFKLHMLHKWRSLAHEINRLLAGEPLAQL